jgi:PAS domain S-box-containing protein
LLAEAITGQFKLNWEKTYDSGLAACKEGSYDICLADYRLGARDGLELVREAIANGCRVPFIVLTGQGSYSVDVEAMRAGATDYLVKGEVSPHLLERAIRYAIGNKQAEEALRKAHDELEHRVRERTRELADTNAKLYDEIEERQRAETLLEERNIALRKSETRFRTLAETTSSAIFILEGTKIRYTNPAVKAITGYAQEDLLDQDFWVIAHPTYQEILKKGGLVNQWGTLVEDESGTQIPSRYEIKLLTKSGEERWVDVTAGQMEMEGKPAVVVTAFDITERDLAEQALRKAKEEESQANAARIEVQRRLIQNREEERLHIAQDLHDGPLQELIGIGFMLKEALQFSRTNNGHNEEVQAALNSMQTNLERQIRDLRLFCSELRPPTLVPFGLEKAILSHAESFQAKYPDTKLHLELMHDGKSLPEPVRLALFRIYQELLNNVIRHSRGSHVDVRLLLEDQQVFFEVQDNGCGFEVPSQWVDLARQGHLGLVGVQERAEAVGGKIEIQSAPGKGTLVRVIVPLKNA